MNLQRYADFAPTGFDTKGLNAKSMGFRGWDGDSDRSDWLLVPVSQTRDSGPLDHSNFETAEKSLEEVDPDGQDHENHRFGHWGPGWYEILIVRPGSRCEGVAEEIVRALEDYPVLDDEDFSQREYDEAAECWRWMGTAERVEYIHRAQNEGYDSLSVFAARRDDMPYGVEVAFRV